MEIWKKIIKKGKQTKSSKLEIGFSLLLTTHTQKGLLLETKEKRHWKYVTIDETLGKTKNTGERRKKLIAIK